MPMTRQKYEIPLLDRVCRGLRAEVLGKFNPNEL